MIPGAGAGAAYIAARPRFTRRADDGAFALFHSAYAGFAAAAHAHAEIQAIVPLVGRMRLATGPLDAVVGPDQVALVPAGLPHAFTYLDGELEFLAIEGPPDWLPLGGPAALHDPAAWATARALAAEVDRPDADPAVLALAREALGRQLRRALRQPAAPAAGMTADPADRRVLAAVDRILAGYPRPMRMEALADEAAMSPRHFERAFRRLVGTTPRQFLIEVRVRAACALLEEGGLPVAEVAARVGFATAAHFTETFGRRMGVGPGAWRRGERP